MALVSGLVGGKEKTMFIYKAEKEEMQRSITYLLGEFSKLYSEFLFLKAKVKVLEGKKPVKSVKTPEQKAKQAEYMRKYTARKRAEKKALA
jgi:hypothetical protein